MKSIKRMSGECFQVEVDFKDCKDCEKEYLLFEKLYSLHPLIFPKHRTKLYKDDKKEDLYYAFTDSELFVCLMSNGKYCFSTLYCNCFYCNKNENNEKKEKEKIMCMEYMEEFNSDGFVIDEWRGSCLYSILFPMPVETFYHIYIIEYSVFDRHCKILYQKDINDKEEFHDYLLKIKKETNLKSNIENDYDAIMFSHDGVIVKSSCIDDSEEPIVINYDEEGEPKDT